MFGKKKEDKPIKSLNIDTLIGENIKFIGKIQGSGNLRVDGIIEGDIDYNGSIVLGDTGKIKGNINCNDITIAGEVNGNVNTKEKLTILPTGTLIGDIEVDLLIVHEQSKFEGNCKLINKTSTTKKISKTEKQESK